MHAWRATLLRVFGATIAKNVSVYPSVKIWYPRNLIMEEQAALGPDVICYCMAKIHLKERAIVSQRATLCAGTHDIDDPEFQLIVKPIELGRSSWVAAEAFVGPGVTIADGAVLGARGVTFKHLEQMQVYGGNPAKKIRPRSSNAVGIERK
jgi:putative colanic acid biosynthesis acetyltransferase WcaF